MAQPMWKPIPMPSSATAGRMASSVNRSLFQAGQLLSSGFEDMAKANTAAKQQASLPQLDFATEQITALNSSDQFTEENRKALLGQLTNQDARREANKVWEQQKASTLAEETAAAKEVRTGEKHLKDLAKIDADILQSDRTGRANLMSASAAQQNAATNAAEFQFRKQTAADEKAALQRITKLANKANEQVQQGATLTEATTNLEKMTADLPPAYQEAALQLLGTLVAPDTNQQGAINRQKDASNVGFDAIKSSLATDAASLQKKITPTYTATDDEIVNTAVSIAKSEDEWLYDENQNLVKQVATGIPKAVADAETGARKQLEQEITYDTMKGVMSNITPKNWEATKTLFIDDLLSDAATTGQIKGALNNYLKGITEREENPFGDAENIGRTLGTQLLTNKIAAAGLARIKGQEGVLSRQMSDFFNFADASNQRLVAAGKSPLDANTLMEQFLAANPQYRKDPEAAKGIKDAKAALRAKAK